MTKERNPKPRAVREPVQVYLAADDSALLAHLVEETGLSKAEILRRGMRTFAQETGATSPMLSFMDAVAEGPWPENGVARDHDAVLAESYAGRRIRRR